MATTTQKTSSVPFGQKVAFGVGMLANQMFPAALGIFMVVLVQDMGFPGWMWGILFFLPRIFDSITDPIMGFISDNTKSVWGRRRQYVIIGAIIMGVSYVIMWQLYRENGITYNFTYFLLWSFAFYLGLTIFSVPYVAMGYEMSDDFHERTDIMAIAQWIGQWAWVLAPWFWVVMYDPDWFPSADVATRTLAIYVGIFCAVLAMIPGIFIPGASTKNDDSLQPVNLKNIGASFIQIIDGFKEAFQSVPFRKLCISTFLIYNAFNTIAAFSFFIVVHYLFGGDAEAAGFWPTLFGSIGALFTTFLVIPIVTWLSKKLGKKNAFLLSQGISIIGYVMLWFLFVPGKPYLFIFALPLFSFGIGSLFTLMMSMTADVCDLDELKTGKRREGIFGAIYWWMVKFGFAIAGLLSGAILSLVGFDPESSTHSSESIVGLRAFFSGLPILGTALAIWVMKDYDLTEEKAREVSAELARRKAPKPSGYQKTSVFKKLDLTQFSQDELNSRFPDFYHPTYRQPELSEAQILESFHNEFDQGLHGICFTVYKKGQNPGDTIYPDQIKMRLEKLQDHTRWIRTFSCTTGHENIPAIAKDMGLKTMVGAWISKNEKQNEREIEGLIELGKQGLVDIAVIGNEVQFRGDQTSSRIISYIQRVKKQLNGIPIGTVDTYNEILSHPEIVNISDLILANCYPFWEGTHHSVAIYSLQEMVRLLEERYPGKKIIISETGWPSRGKAVDRAVPSIENAAQYFTDIHKWARDKNIPLFYFSSFDEAWKYHAEGWAGTAWGLWRENEEFKFSNQINKQKI